MQEQHIKVPPWSKKRRIYTAIVCTIFILLASGFIGVGLFQTGVQAGFIKPSMTKASLLESLLNDAQFIRTVKHAAQLKECVNSEKKFKLTYEAPLHLTKVKTDSDNCTGLVTTHPTGSTVTVTLNHENQSREALVLSKVEEYEQVHTDILSGTAYETSVLSGVRNGVLVTLYVIGVGPDTSWVVEYLPTTPLVDGNVLELVESFRLI